MFSGGVGSWAAAKRVADRHGTENMTLLFADTNMEDEDLYRFLDEAADNIGVPVTCIADGRTPWQVFRDVRYLGNSRIDPCSQILKRGLLTNWVESNCDPAATICYVGIDWTEQHRFFGTEKTRGLKQRYADKGWRYEAPLCDRPVVSKDMAMRWLDDEGIKRPRLYDMGFPHNNCGGFCIKAGIAHFTNLLEKMPERFLHHEQQEQQIRDDLGKDVSILRDRRGGKTTPLTLRQLRLRVQGNRDPLSEDERCDWGGCGCAIDAPEEEEAN